MGPKLVRAVALSVAALAMSLPSRSADVVACDLIQANAAAQILSEPIKQHTPNRSVEVVEGVRTSTCIFFASRSSLRVSLQQFADGRAAEKAFSTATQSGGFAAFKDEGSLGDRAKWWSGAREAHGYIVLVGSRVVLFDTRWSDGADATAVKGRLRSVVVDALKRTK